MMVKVVQAEFSGIKDTVEEAKAIGIDVEPAKARVKEAREHFEEEDLEGAQAILHGTRTTLKEKIGKYDSIKDKIHRAEELITEAQANRADVSKQGRSLELAKTMFRSGAFDDADKMLDELMDEAEKKLAMYLAAKFILTSKESIEMAEAHGIDVSDAGEMLATAKDLMKAKDYEQALETAKRCSENAVQTVSQAAQEMIKDLQRLVTDAKNVGVDTSGPEQLADKAAELVKNEDYAEALRCIDSAKYDIDQVKNMSSQAAVEIKVARTNLKDAEALDMQVVSARELLDQAVEALTRHQYAIALELAKKSSESSSEVTRNTIWTTLERFKERIERASSEGTDTGIAERCVAEGVAAFNEKRYQDALKRAMQCEAEIDKAELQREVGLKAVEMAQKRFEDAAREGIKSDAVAKMLSEAEELLRRAKYVDALTKSLEIGDKLHTIRERVDSARIEMSSVKEQVERLRKVGIDTSASEEMLKDARDALAKHDFDKARETLRGCSQKTVELFEASIDDVMKQNKDLISRAKSMGLVTKQCEDLMEVAKTSFSEKLWDFAFQQAQACRGMCIEVISKKIDNLADDASTRLEPLRASGASVRSVEELIDQAKEAVSNGDASEAFQILMEADQRILGVEDSHKKFVDMTIATESAIEVMKRLGVSTSEAERLLALADLEREKDYESAIEFVAEALDAAKATIESYAPEVTGDVTSAGLQEGSEGELTVRLKNTGNVLARDVSVELSGQFRVSDLPEVASLRPGAETVLKVKVVPDTSGDIPVRVNISCKRHFDGAPYSFEFDGTAKAFKTGPPFKVARAEGLAKCAYCQGKIKQGFDVVNCRCGKVLHLACAKRTGACPSCGQKYSF
jgi:tetratricopeptide (TPR) repeat protein